MDYKQIGNQIRKFRKQKGLSQEELAEKVNISTTHMSHIETGNTKLSLPVLVDLAAALQVGTDVLLFSGEDFSDDRLTRDVSAIFSQCDRKKAGVLLDILRGAKTALDKVL